MFQRFTYLYLTRNCGCAPPPFRNLTVAAWVYSDSRSAIASLMALLPFPLIFWQSNAFISLFHIGKKIPFSEHNHPDVQIFPTRYRCRQYRVILPVILMVPQIEHQFPVYDCLYHPAPLINVLYSMEYAGNKTISLHILPSPESP